MFLMWKLGTLLNLALHRGKEMQAMGTRLLITGDEGRGWKIILRWF